MSRFGVALILFGGLVLILFLLLPLFAPGNALSSAMFTPLFCVSDETYTSEAVQSTNFQRSQILVLRASCVSTEGRVRDVSTQQVNIGVIAGIAPFVVGVTILACIRVLRQFSLYWAMGRQQTENREPDNLTIHTGIYGAQTPIRRDDYKEK